MNTSLNTPDGFPRDDIDIPQSAYKAFFSAASEIIADCV